MPTIEYFNDSPAPSDAEVLARHDAWLDGEAINSCGFVVARVVPTDQERAVIDSIHKPYGDVTQELERPSGNGGRQGDLTPIQRTTLSGLNQAVQQVARWHDRRGGFGLRAIDGLVRAGLYVQANQIRFHPDYTTAKIYAWSHGGATRIAVGSFLRSQAMDDGLRHTPENLGFTILPLNDYDVAYFEGCDLHAGSDGAGKVRVFMSPQIELRG